MDPITHLLTGAAIGEAYLGRKAGNKAVLWGAIAGILPDIDLLLGQFMSMVNEFAFHRGVTHSIVFMLMISPVFGIFLNKIYKNTPVSWKRWTVLFLLALTSHLLLDFFTNWEMLLFWPLDYKVANQNIFVIDPLFTLPLLVCIVWMMFKRQKSQIRKKLAVAGLLISSAYMTLTLINKIYINRIFADALTHQNIPYTRFKTKPTLFNNILWVATAETPKGFYTGYYSHFDKDKNIVFHFFEKRHHLIEPYLHHPDVQKMLDFTMGYFTVEQKADTVVINDLRFGQSAGWERGKGNFVFSYFIIPENDNVKIEDRRNTVKESGKMLRPLWARMLGDENVVKEQEL